MFDGCIHKEEMLQLVCDENRLCGNARTALGGDFMVGSLARAAEAMVGDHLSGRQMLFNYF